MLLEDAGHLSLVHTWMDVLHAAIFASAIIAVETGIALNARVMKEKNGYRQGKQNSCRFLIFM